MPNMMNQQAQANALRGGSPGSGLSMAGAGRPMPQQATTMPLGGAGQSTMPFSLPTSLPPQTAPLMNPGGQAMPAQANPQGRPFQGNMPATAAGVPQGGPLAQPAAPAMIPLGGVGMSSDPYTLPTTTLPPQMPPVTSGGGTLAPLTPGGPGTSTMPYTLPPQQMPPQIQPMPPKNNIPLPPQPSPTGFGRNQNRMTSGGY